MNSQRLLIATRNKGKLSELRQLLWDLALDICDLDSFALIETVPETGSTFRENASLKAAGYAKQAGVLTLADDSGLEVDALGGAPGVFSARYGGEGASDSDRTAKLLSEIVEVPARERTARFVSAIAIADKGGEIINVSNGTCEGVIARAPVGSRGFGYDPIFIPTGFQQSFGQLEPEVKNRISHRARALSAAKDFLRALTTTSLPR